MDVKKNFSELQEVKQEIFRRKVKNFRIAEHHSPFKGSGYEMHSINRWNLGDPVNSIDWSLSLRTWPKTTYILNKVETKNAPTVLVSDISPSVFAGVERDNGKFKLLLHLVGALGFASGYFHDPVGVLAVSKEIEFYLRPKLGSGQTFYACELLLEKAAEVSQTIGSVSEKSSEKPSLNLALEFLLARFRSQGSIVILSDFVDVISGDSDLDFRIIETLSSLHNWNVIAIFLDDPEEFNWSGREGTVNVRNIETGKLEKIKARHAFKIRKDFVDKRENLRKKLGQAGVDSTVLSFGDHFNQLSQFLSERRSFIR